MSDAAGEPREVNPLLVAVFCPQCVLSGAYALLAAGSVSVPSLFGVPAEHVVAPALVLGSFFAWLAWGAFSKRDRDADEACAGACR